MSVIHDLNLKRSPPPHVTEQSPHEAQSPHVPTGCTVVVLTVLSGVKVVVLTVLVDVVVVMPSVDDTVVVESLPATYKSLSYMIMSTRAFDRPACHKMVGKRLAFREDYKIQCDFAHHRPRVRGEAGPCSEEQR